MIKTKNTDDGVVEYSYRDDTLILVTLLKDPEDGYVVHIPNEIDGQKINQIGNEEDSICSKTYAADPYTKAYKGKVSIIVDDSISCIKDGAFRCIDVKELHWPSACKTIPFACFEDSIILNITGIENVEAIEERAFATTKGLKSFCIPDTCTTIGKNAFFSSSVEKINGGRNVKTVEPCAFKKSAIKEFNWPEKCIKVPFGCFSNCTGLKSISGTENIEKICGAAFSSCSALSYFKFSDKLRSLNDYAFYETNIKCADISNTMVDYIPNGTFAHSKIEKFFPNPLCTAHKGAFSNTPYAERESLKA